MLPNGTKMSDIDRAAEDHPDERPCEVCGHDAGECTCDENDGLLHPPFASNERSADLDVLADAMEFAAALRRARSKRR